MPLWASILRIPDPVKVKDALEQTLAKSPFTINSLYGFIILAVIIFLIVKFFSDIGRCVRFVVSFIVLWELSHVLVTETQLGSWVPFLGNLFKFDILTAFAQMCVGTPLSTGLLWLQAYLNTVVGGAFSTIFHILRVFVVQVSRAMGIVSF